MDRLHSSRLPATPTNQSPGTPKCRSKQHIIPCQNAHHHHESCSSTLDLCLPETRRGWRCQLRRVWSVVGLVLRPWSRLCSGIHIEAQQLLLIAVCTLWPSMITVDIVFTTGFAVQRITVMTGRLWGRRRSVSRRGVIAGAPHCWPKPLREASADAPALIHRGDLYRVRFAWCWC